MSFARSNTRSHFLVDLIDDRDQTIRTAEMTTFGGGFGAWVKGWQRALAVLFPGVDVHSIRTVDAGDSITIVRIGAECFTLRTTPVSK